MSASRFNEDIRPVAPGDRISQALTAARFNSMATLAREAAMGTHVRGGPGVRVKSGPGGVVISARRQRSVRSGASSLCLYPRRTGAGEYTVSPGLFNLMPVRHNSSSGDELDGTQALTLTTGIIYLVIVYDTTFVEDYLTYHALNTVYTHDDTTLPADEAIMDGTDIVGWRFHAPLATVEDDAIVLNYGGSNLWGVMRDNSTLTAAGASLAVGRSYP